MNTDLINDFYLKSTPEEKCQFLWLIAEKITIPVKRVDDEGKPYTEVMELDNEIPVVMNGPSYQFNTDDLYEEEKKKENAKK
tara:strand:+ start:1352 stop:1597 length:246 start_codon:yes stop_codon:yes gene_type:complete